MLGKWLERLTPEQEDRLLTQVLVPFIAVRAEGGGCLVGVAGTGEWGLYPGHWPIADLHTGFFFTSPAARFNHLCQRLVGVPQAARLDFSGHETRGREPEELEGGARAAVLIRNRILRNRARRALAGITPQPQLEGSVRA